MRRRPLVPTALLCASVALCVTQARAQFLGHNTPGDFGLQSGSQAPPGVYLVTPLFVRYDAGTLRNGLGNALPGETEVDMNAYVFGVSWVSNTKVLGANYSLQVYLPFTNNALEAPILGFDQSTDTGLSDLYVQPINLGWHMKNADFIAGLGVFAPTGRFEIDADDNLGLGMWTFEVFGGTTVFFDEAKSWHVATTAFYETHTEKEGSDARVGDILTFEGGFGKSFKQGTWNVGLAYYAQFKITDDDFGMSIPLPPTFQPAKHQGFCVGPEVSIPLASTRKLYGFLNFRYLWETGVRNNLEGNMFLLTASFPIPSVSLQ
jgi:hypothetical protein